jgi:hypothetical protein
MTTTDVKALADRLRVLQDAEELVTALERLSKTGDYRNLVLFPIGERRNQWASFPIWAGARCADFVDHLLADARREVSQRRAELDLLMAQFKNV